MRKLFLATLTIVALLGATVGAKAYTALKFGISGTGVEQGDLVILLQNIVDVVNELQADNDTQDLLLDEIHDQLLFTSADITMLASILDGNPGAIGISSAGSSLVATTLSLSSAGALTNSTPLTLSAP